MRCARGKLVEGFAAVVGVEVEAGVEVSVGGVGVGVGAFIACCCRCCIVGSPLFVSSFLRLF